MSEELVHVMRGGLLECVHHGDIAVVDDEGHVVAYCGDPYRKTFFRSAAKPMQALSVILSGAAERFGLADDELAVMCGSHYGEDFHRAAVARILQKIGLTPDALRTPESLSIKSGVRTRQIRERVIPDRIGSNCSGKHAGFLAVCAAKGYSTHDYDAPDHPAQRDVLDILAELCDMPTDAIGIGEDGCGVPVHYMSLYRMALCYARFANPHTLPPKYRDACRRIANAMNAHPEMVAGTGGFCTELLRHTNGRLVAKLGAEAVYCVGVRDKGKGQKNLGIAVKIDDGNSSRALHPTVMRASTQTGLLTTEETKALSRFVNPQNVNEHGHLVGEISAVFDLKHVE